MKFSEVPLCCCWRGMPASHTVGSATCVKCKNGHHNRCLAVIPREHVQSSKARSNPNRHSLGRAGGLCAGMQPKILYTGCSWWLVALVSASV
jgi:hypothetical protein